VIRNRLTDSPNTQANMQYNIQINTAPIHTHTHQAN
jgi:hypothetical protein